MNGACKVQIACFDRPALRQLPRSWTLEELRPTVRRWWQSPDRWVGIACAIAYLVLIAQAVAQMGAE